MQLIMVSYNASKKTNKQKKQAKKHRNGIHFLVTRSYSHRVTVPFHFITAPMEERKKEKKNKNIKKDELKSTHLRAESYAVNTQLRRHAEHFVTVNKSIPSLTRKLANHKHLIVTSL